MAEFPSNFLPISFQILFPVIFPSKCQNILLEGNFLPSGSFVANTISLPVSMEMLVNLAHAQTNFPAADEASYPRKRGKNAGKQAKAA
jgi:hypothetical protein